MGPTDGSDQCTQAAQKCSDTSDGEYHLGHDISAEQTDNQRLQLTRRIVGGDSSFDVVGFNVTWTPGFTEAGWAFPPPENMAKRVTEDTLSGPLDMATWQDQLYGAPLNTNVQLLWYRKSLVDGPPETWDNLIASRERLVDEGKPSMIGIQAVQHEGSAIWLNSMMALTGGQLVVPDGQLVTIANNDATERALDITHRVAAAKRHNPSISQSGKNQARLVFDHGDAFAQVSCSFMYTGAEEKAGSGNQAAKEVFEDTAWIIHPAMDEGTPAQVTVGGLNLAVPLTPKHPELVFETTNCLHNEQDQLSNVLKGGLPSTLTKLYTRAADDFKKEYPFCREIYEQLNTLKRFNSAKLTQKERTLSPSPRTVGVMTHPKSPVYQSLSILVVSRISPPENVDARSLVGTLDEELQAVVSLEDLVP